MKALTKAYNSLLSGDCVTSGSAIPSSFSPLLLHTYPVLVFKHVLN